MHLLNCFPVISYLVIQARGQLTSCNCGVRKQSPISLLISGGEEAERNEFPWAALLRIRRKGQSMKRCGGTLINDRFVLTAAHCVDKPTGIDVEVILGEHNTNRNSETQELRIRAKPPFIVHDSYSSNLVGSPSFVVYDFTLIKLSTSVDFSQFPHIRPACLPEPSTRISEGDPVTVVGWGNTQVDFHPEGDNIIQGEDRAPSPVLKKLNLKLSSKKKCQNIFSPLSVDIRDINVCAASNTGDACGGDSGGGMVKQNRNGGFYELIGVVSFGVGCRSTINGQPIPGVYAKVSSVLNWIERKTSSGRFCKKPKGGTLFPPQSFSGWGEWSSFSQCSKPAHICGVGKKTRDRFCKGIACNRTQQTQERVCNYRKC